MVAVFPLGFPVLAAIQRGWALPSQPGISEATVAHDVANAGNIHLKPEPAWRDADLMALAVLSQVQRFLLTDFVESKTAGVLEAAVATYEAGEPVVGAAEVAKHFDTFFRIDPADAAWSPADVAREWLLVRLIAENGAVTSYLPLVDDDAVRADEALQAFGDHIEAALMANGPISGTEVDILSLLRAPRMASPDSLEGQLAYVATHFRDRLPKWLLTRLLRTRGALAEASAHRGGGPGPSEALRFDGPFYGGEDDRERFTDDQGWMPGVVLIAKSVHVWLDQLSRTFGRPIARLDAIPDETLDTLAQSGFNALWLIGTWERSQASRQIKQRMGNPEALASAYSLHDYTIADALGGEGAWETLKQRCAARGIRLATDMVPNHTGLDSDWMIHHPERFLQLSEPPYPAYRFTGPDLCDDGRVGVYLEDGYWDQTDAAVVFKRLDHHTGEARYVYHGNDGTQMPWNDTAQLDYASAEVREAVIETILAVARRAPIIRFDAAMTLARRHVRRLWHPPPGEAGAVPSRSAHGLSAEAFDAAVPTEFWRDVVERVQREAPDTLLVAEAFWMMEGYFVRTLGMHRVYNSAFMHMLRDEDNAKLRDSIKNVLSYSPPILQRFVNFMNNPDEETAAEQFGAGDKYFGVALLLVTLPGMPMFGHGQVEGFAEKYGMEYARAYRDEQVDDALVARHAREIFPLMRRRYLFSQVDDFALFDVRDGHGSVQENVFAYSNGHHGPGGVERTLVFYNNGYERASGWIHEAAPQLVGGADAPRTRTLTEAMGLAVGPGRLVAMREIYSDTTYLRWSEDLAMRGIYVELDGYGKQVLMDFREVHADPLWAALAVRFGDTGIRDFDRLLAVLASEAARTGDLLEVVTVSEALLGVHEHDGTRWVVAERLSALTDALTVVAQVWPATEGMAGQLADAAAESGYDYAALLKTLAPSEASSDDTEDGASEEE